MRSTLLMQFNSPREWVSEFSGDSFMTPDELLKLPRQAWSSTLEELLRGHYFDHTPELLEPWEEFKGTRAELVGEYWFDERRLWRLAVLAYHGTPFLVVQNAGREGDDHAMRVLLDQELYRCALSAQGTCRTERAKLESNTRLDHNVRGLGSFYGRSLGSR